MDWRTGNTQVRRGRKLVISFFCTIANYEYGFAFHLDMAGGIEVEAKLTGILSTGALTEDEMKPQKGADPATGLPVVGRKYGLTLSLGGLYAPIHQHFFVARLDMAVDGLFNDVVEVETRRAAVDSVANPFKNAFHTTHTVLTTELGAMRDADARKARHWRIESAPSPEPGSTIGGTSVALAGAGAEQAASGDDLALAPATVNRTGVRTAYALHPHAFVAPFAHPDAAFLMRAGFLLHQLWVTPYARSERFPGGDYPNQADAPDGLPKWVRGDRPVRGKDVVVWHCFGVTHAPRLEDWPVMPVEKTGFSLKPSGFFDRSPALDVPPAERIPNQVQNTKGRSCGDDRKGDKDDAVPEHAPGALAAKL
jgi:primary-amine oxidase